MKARIIEKCDGERTTFSPQVKGLIFWKALIESGSRLHLVPKDTKDFGPSYFSSYQEARDFIQRYNDEQKKKYTKIHTIILGD